MPQQKPSYEELQKKLKNANKKIDSLLKNKEGENGCKPNDGKIKELKEKLRRVQENYENLLQFAPTGIYEIDFVNRKLVYVNKVIERITGYSNDELLKMDPMDLLTDSSKKKFSKRLVDAQNGKDLSQQVEYEIKTKNGDILWTLINVNFIKHNGQITGATVVAYDITESKKYERIIEENQKRLERAEKIGHIGNVELDIISNQIYWSDEMYEIYERNPKLGPPSYNEIINLHDKNDAKKLKGLVKRAIKNVEPYKMDLKANLPNGTLKFFHVQGHPITGENGTVTKIVGTVQDVTERKRIELKLIDEKQRIKSILDSIDDGIYIVNDDHEIEYVNPTIKKEFGDIQNKKCFEYFHQRDSKCPWCKLDQVKKGNRVQWQWRSPVSNNFYDIVESPIIHIDGSISKLKILRDMTRQKESEIQLQTIIDHTPDIIARFDRNHRHLFVSPSIEKVTGLNPRDYIGKTNQELGMPFSLYKKWNAMIDMVISTKKTQSSEFVFPGPNGDITYFWLLVPEFDEQQNVTSVIAFARDITEQKRYEEKIEDVAKFPMQNPHPVLRISTDGRILFSNPSGEKFLQNWGKKIGHKIPRKYQKNITRALESGEIIDQKIEVDNNWYHLSFVPIVEKQYVNIYSLDITKTIHLQQSLSITEERYRLAQQAAGIGSWDWDIQSNKIHWSNNIYQIFGISKDTFDGTIEGFLHLVHPEDRKKIKENIQETMENKKDYYVEHRIQTSNNEIRWVEENGRVFYNEDGTPYRMLGVTSDITQEKQWEILQTQLYHEIQNERDILEIIMENTDALLAYIGKDYRFIKVNSEFAKRNGFKKEDLIGKNYLDLFRYPETKEKLVSVLKTGKEVELIGKPYKLAGEKSITYWNWSAIPVTDAEKNIKGIVISQMDVTDIKQAENHLERLNQAMIKKTTELAVANNELEAFTYSASHDLQAPLRSISGFSEILLEDYQNRLDDEGVDYLNRICRASNKMSNLINDLLRLSRISRKEIKTEQINLSKISSTIIHDLRQNEPNRAMTIEIQPDMMIKADRELFAIALDNLIRNSWKFTKKQNRPKIQIGAIEKDGGTIYYIKDNGAGFDNAYADKLFVPFQRLHDKEEFKGSGIGLPIVARIIHRHNGEIWGEGKPGKGATFYFTLDPVKKTDT